MDDEERHGMHDGVGHGEGTGTEGEPPETGHPDVDEVLASLDGVSQLPLADQVEVFERAHARLRGALDRAVGTDAPGHRG